MPKNFRTKLAGTVVTLAMVAAPVAAFADEAAAPGFGPEGPSMPTLGEEVPTLDYTEIPCPEVPAGELEKPVSEGLGPLGGVMPTLDGNGYNTNTVPNKTGQAKKTTAKTTSTTKVTNPKTGDASMLAYAGLGLASIAGMLRKRK